MQGLVSVQDTAAMVEALKASRPGAMEALFDLGLRMMVFSTLEEAIDWLDGV